jgi:hypothetical protein
MTKTSKPAAITFPMVSKNVRRNAETGVEIRKDGAEYAIVVPSIDGLTAPRFALTLADARREATAQAEMIREAIADAYDSAAAEADAALAEQAARLPRGQRVTLTTGRRNGMAGRVDGDVKLDAETGRPFVTVKLSTGDYRIEWCDSLITVG